MAEAKGLQVEWRFAVFEMIRHGGGTSVVLNSEVGIFSPCIQKVLKEFS